MRLIHCRFPCLADLSDLEVLFKPARLHMKPHRKDCFACFLTPCPPSTRTFAEGIKKRATISRNPLILLVGRGGLEPTTKGL